MSTGRLGLAGPRQKSTLFTKKEKEKRKGEEQKEEGKKHSCIYRLPLYYIFPPPHRHLTGQRERGTKFLLYFKGVQVHKENSRVCREEEIRPHQTSFPISWSSYRPASLISCSVTWIHRALEFLQVRLSSPGTLAWSRPRARRGKHDL